MFFWITSNARCRLTHGIGHKHKYNTCSRLIVSSFAIFRIAMIIALFLPISRTHFYHHKMSDKQDDDQNLKLNDYHNFYENIPSSHLLNNLQFRHHQIKKKLGLHHTKFYEYDSVVDDKENGITTDLEIKFQHHPRLKTRTKAKFKNSPNKLKTKSNFTNITNHIQSPEKITKYKDSERGTNVVSSEGIRIADREDKIVTISTLRGNTITVPCKRGKGIISAGMVSWRHADGTSITNERFSAGNDGNLIVANAQPSDSNNYICKIEENEQYESVLKVYEPKVPALEVHIQYKLYTNESDKCKHSEILSLKTYLNKEISNICENNLCAMTDLRISCQFNSHKQLDMQMIIYGVLTEDIIKNCQDKQCMETYLEEAFIKVKRALQNIHFIKISNNDDQTSTKQKRTLFKTRSVATCIGGHGLQDDKCMPCKPGYYSSDGSTDCVQCHPNTYQPKYGKKQCISCKKYWSKPGSKTKGNCHYKIVTEILSNNLQIIIPLIIGIVFLSATIVWILYLTLRSAKEFVNR